MEGRKQVIENGRRRANPTCSLEATGDRSTGAGGESRYGGYAIGDHLRQVKPQVSPEPSVPGRTGG